MKNLYRSLANFQQEVPVIHKATEGYGYSYADLPSIFPIINPILKKHGLGFTQLIEGTNLKTIVFHVESGEQIESNTHIPQNVALAKMNAFQVLGSAITYIRRYALSSVLGLVTDKDTDAAGTTAKPASKPNVVSIPATLLNTITKGLANINTPEELEVYGKSNLNNIKTYPQIKAMFTSKKIAINGN